MDGYLLFVVIAVGAVGLLLLAIRAVRRPTSSSSSVVGWTRLVAIVAAVLLAIVNVVVAVSIMVGQPVDVTVPVHPFWPDYPNVGDVEPDRGGAVQAEITEVTVTSSALGLTTRLLLAIGTLLEASAVLAVIIAVIILCNRLRSGHPFSAGLRRTGYATAVIVLTGGVIGQVLGGIGASRAGQESLAITSWSVHGQGEEFAGNPWPEPGFMVNIEFGPIFLALVIMVVVELVGAGLALSEKHRRLQADTDGLV